MHHPWADRGSALGSISCPQTAAPCRRPRRRSTPLRAAPLSRHGCYAELREKFLLKAFKWSETVGIFKGSVDGHQLDEDGKGAQPFTTIRSAETIARVFRGDVGVQGYACCRDFFVASASFSRSDIVPLEAQIVLRQVTEAYRASTLALCRYRCDERGVCERLLFGVGITTVSA